ncbi:MAG: hypothetical protein BWY55_00354 [archaeon ADurb.Bin336]|nr:MAG: hypothetical protein BWY55_00354 [archaeon ADurb.Bin336]
MDFEKIITCMKQINFKPNIKNFNDKLIIQKIVFLLQEKGIDCGANYGLYIRGPYSPNLTNCMYNEKEKFESLKSNKKLTQKEETILNEFKEVFPELTPGILEIAATYAYFAFRKKENPKEALLKVKELKGFYPEAQIALGVLKAKQVLYEPTKQELKEMKKEFNAWEKSGT